MSKKMFFVSFKLNGTASCYIEAENKEEAEELAYENSTLDEWYIERVDFIKEVDDA